MTTSIPRIKSIIESMSSGLLTKHRDFIQYDPESWDATPASEYNPGLPNGNSVVQSIGQCSDIVHQAGYLFSIAPQFTGGPKALVKPNPFLLRHYKEIVWRRVDKLVIQLQGGVKKHAFVDEAKQIYRQVKSQSPEAQVFVQVGLTKGTDCTPAQVISYLSELSPDYDGIQVIFLPNAPACTDERLDELLRLLAR